MLKRLTWLYKPCVAQVVAFRVLFWNKVDNYFLCKSTSPNFNTGINEIIKDFNACKFLFNSTLNIKKLGNILQKTFSTRLDWLTIMDKDQSNQWPSHLLISPISIYSCSLPLRLKTRLCQGPNHLTHSHLGNLRSLIFHNTGSEMERYYEK